MSVQHLESHTAQRVDASAGEMMTQLPVLKKSMTHYVRLAADCKCREIHCYFQEELIHPPLTVGFMILTAD